MKRGVVTIDQSSLRSLLNFVQIEASFDPFLLEKIQSALAATSFPTQLQLSETEVESLLDLLPPPNQLAQPAEKQLHQTLAEFNRKLKL